jgi:hypothetical protein
MLRFYVNTGIFKNKYIYFLIYMNRIFILFFLLPITIKIIFRIRELKNKMFFLKRKKIT